ncbi:nuclear transport factor 2 family protein [Nocardia ignorata]|uniref:nuclear transport factor 2 family protein n=1 Tax=Nocardia ignorata TaxID=145285 RepID=UPI00363598EA
MGASNTLADTSAITETITRMFVYCDRKRWDDLVTEVFTDEVDFDGGFGGGVSIRLSKGIAPTGRRTWTPSTPSTTRQAST